MPYDPQRHHRRSIRLPGCDYGRAGAYVVTIVCHDRQCLFGEVVEGKMVLNAWGRVAQREWERLPRRFPHVELDAFVIMPDHIHGIVVIPDRGSTAGESEAPDEHPSRRAPTATREQFGQPVAGSIPTVVRSFKSAVTVRVNLMRDTPGAPVWQRNYWEHIIRNERDLTHAREYIANNPARWAQDRLHP